MHLVVNLGLLFKELPWPERFAAAAGVGVSHVEFPWPPLPPDEVTRLVRSAGLRVALLNMDAGDLDAGDRGYTNDPRLVARWRERMREALDLAVAVDSPLVNVLTGRRLTGVDDGEQAECLAANLRWAAERAAARDRTLVVEPINDRDAPGYLLPRVADVLGLLDAVGHDAVRLQLDAYHVASMGDDVAGTVALAGARIGHVQVADFPGRHEPGTGDLDLPALLAALAEAGYDGGLALEYVPTGPSTDSLHAVTTTLPPM
jgi:hydroxypyruvate isomerase